MKLILRRCATLVLAVLAAACEDDCAYDSGLIGAPAPTLDGIWEGRESPFTAKDTYPWWQFDVEQYGGSSGTFVTDRPFHQFHQGPRGDTIRGEFSGYHCFRRDEIDWLFELRYRAYTTQCTLNGKVSGGNRIDGLLGCAYADSGGKYWKALYLIHERARN